jgi:hypothetical protein
VWLFKAIQKPLGGHMDIGVTMNLINAELLIEALENKDLEVLGEQSTDEILLNLKDSLTFNNNNIQHKKSK